MYWISIWPREIRMHIDILGSRLIIKFWRNKLEDFYLNRCFENYSLRILRKFVKIKKIWGRLTKIVRGKIIKRRRGERNFKSLRIRKSKKIRGTVKKIRIWCKNLRVNSN